MISYCPLDEIDTPAPPPSARVAAAAAPRREIPVRAKKEAPTAMGGFLDGEDTECNYLVLFFILGVLILACSDSVSIRR